MFVGQHLVYADSECYLFARVLWQHCLELLVIGVLVLEGSLFLVIPRHEAIIGGNTTTRNVRTLDPVVGSLVRNELHFIRVTVFRDDNTLITRRARSLAVVR